MKQDSLQPPFQSIEYREGLILTLQFTPLASDGIVHLFFTLPSTVYLSNACIRRACGLEESSTTNKQPTFHVNIIYVLFISYLGRSVHLQ